MINYLDHAKSLTLELKSTKERLENLIHKLKHTNWGEVGKYKESILINLLREHLPKSIYVGSGFIVNHVGNISNQIDIIIYDETPLLFQKGDFIVANSIGVIGIIEVKTSLTGVKSVKDTLLKLEQNGKLLNKNRFVGLFVYEGNLKLVENLSKVLSDIKEPGIINHLFIGFDYFMRFWNENEVISEKTLFENSSIHSIYQAYHIEDLALSYFIGSIIEYIMWEQQKFPLEMYKKYFPKSYKKEFALCEFDVKLAVKD